jgi:hypothetical protein
MGASDNGLPLGGDDEIPVTGDDGGPSVGLTEPAFQVPLPENPLRAGSHVEFSALAVAEGAPGEGVRLLVEEPGPKTWVTGKTLICKGDKATGRPVCRHYVAMLTDAEGAIAGFEMPKQIHRFCTRLASQSELMQIGEVSMYACTVRDPRDEASAREIEAFEERQEAMARESARTTGEIDF